MYWLWYIMIGITAGYLAGLSVKEANLALIIKLTTGIVGGILGGWAFRFMSFGGADMLGSLITSTMGAIILLLVAELFIRSRGSNRKRITSKSSIYSR